ncbi:MAG: 16S rRNA (cytosine(967)-C(5))-methyltransferase RsmB [Desulfuromonas sp.]|nr:MAG: 16S rRNA (cytosine(967)-C(5))-methyltransferase RsmB [Desulfuromonas sp.]
MPGSRQGKPDSRQSAFNILCRVEEGGYADLLLDHELRRSGLADPRDRGLLTELVYGVLRQRGRLDFALGQVARQPLAKIEDRVVQLLRLGAYQLLLLDRIPASAAVDTTVRLAKANGLQRATGFINGILRNLDRRRENIPWPDPARKPDQYFEHMLSLPPWLARDWRTRWGDEGARELAARLLEPAPLTVRVNTLRGGRGELLSRLHAEGLAAEECSFAPEGVRVTGQAALTALDNSEFQVQDEASMLIAHLVGCRSGETILDACAAPGGKTTHLAALGENRATITALDLHPHRLKLLREGAERLGCQGITSKSWDLSSRPDFLPPASFDRILVDAPCSGLGVLRRNPELRWRRQPRDIVKLAALQSTILGNVAHLLKPGGVLLYSVCTVSREETEGVLASFLATHSDFVVDDLAQTVPATWRHMIGIDGTLQTWPGETMLDGFFAARLMRQAKP